jgi:hypothetical protein
MIKKRKSLTALLIVFCLLALQGSLMAKKGVGANLAVKKIDGQEVGGELIAVKKDSLLLLDSETERDLTVDIKDVKAVTIVKKSSWFEFGILGFLAGGVLRGVLHSQLERDVHEEEATAHQVQDLFLWGAIGAVPGVAVGALLGINKTYKIEGKSEAEIQNVLENLRKHAREPNFQ